MLQCKRITQKTVSYLEHIYVLF